MANCPKCGYHLRMIDIKADCPKCGVNLIYYNHQERLDADADKAEEEHIKFQPKIDRVKFACYAFNPNRNAFLTPGSHFGQSSL